MWQEMEAEIEKTYGKAVFRAAHKLKQPTKRVSVPALQALASARPGRPGFGQNVRAPRLFKVNFMANDNGYINSRDFRNFIKMRILMLASARGVGIRGNDINWVDIGQYAANKKQMSRYLKISRNGNGLYLRAQSNHFRQQEQETNGGASNVPRAVRGVRPEYIYTWNQLPQNIRARQQSVNNLRDLNVTQSILNIAQAAAGRQP